MKLQRENANVFWFFYIIFFFVKRAVCWWIIKSFFSLSIYISLFRLHVCVCVCVGIAMTMHMAFARDYSRKYKSPLSAICYTKGRYYLRVWRLIYSDVLIENNNINNARFVNSTHHVKREMGQLRKQKLPKSL